jgi:hypothetical protein
MGPRTRPRSFRVVLGLAVAALALGVLAPASRSAGATVTLARMSIRIDTTSDWTALLVTGRLAGTRVTSNPSGVNVTVRDSMIDLHGVPSSGASVELDTVFEEASGAPTISFAIQKGFRGAARAVVDNTSHAPFTAFAASNDRQSMADSTNQMTWSLARDSVMGTVPFELDHADGRRLVLAFYYGWYSSGTYDSMRAPDQPQFRADTQSVDDVYAMASQARAHGIDGFIQSWAGEGHDGPEMTATLAAAERAGTVVSGYLETATANAVASELLAPQTFFVTRWLAELIDRAASPAFLRADGVPVVFVYQMAKLPASEWRVVLSTLESTGRSVRLVGDATSPAYRDVEWGLHRYNPNVENGRVMSESDLAAWNDRWSVDVRAGALTGAGGATRLFAATVSPGYTSPGLLSFGPRVDRGADGERYQDNWDATVGADPDWVLVTSWNEWFEATAVQPSVAYGDRALQQTSINAAAFRQR